jgi:hypothetical protein
MKYLYEILFIELQLLFVNNKFMGIQLSTLLNKSQEKIPRKQIILEQFVLVKLQFLDYRQLREIIIISRYIFERVKNLIICRNAIRSSSCRR